MLSSLFEILFDSDMLRTSHDVDDATWGQRFTRATRAYSFDLACMTRDVPYGVQPGLDKVARTSDTRRVEWDDQVGFDGIGSLEHNTRRPIGCIGHASRVLRAPAHI